MRKDGPAYPAQARVLASEWVQKGTIITSIKGKSGPPDPGAARRQFRSPRGPAERPPWRPMLLGAAGGAAEAASEA